MKKDKTKTTVEELSKYSSSIEVASVVQNKSIIKCLEVLFYAGGYYRYYVYDHRIVRPLILETECIRKAVESYNSIEV